jgi:hypothetical protein
MRTHVPISVWTCLASSRVFREPTCRRPAGIRACRVGERIGDDVGHRRGRIAGGVLKENVTRLSDVVLLERDAVTPAVARRKSGDVGGHPRDDGRRGRRRGRRCPDERATLRVGDVFLKIDGDQTCTDVEVEAMARAPVPTPEILWRKPPVLALAALPGRHSATSASRRPRRPRRGPRRAPPSGHCITRRCRHGPVGASTRSHRTSPASASGSSPTTSFPPTWSHATAGSPRPRFGRGHRCSSTATCKSSTSSSSDEVTGVIDWSEASQGDALFDLATLTLGHPEHLGDVVAG